MATKTELKAARQILDRFFRDAEGKTNRQVDVYFALDDLGIDRDEAEPGLDFLSGRGLINRFGRDIAFLTEAGVAAVVGEKDIGAIPVLLRDWATDRPSVAPSELSELSEDDETSPTPVSDEPRPAHALLTFLGTDGVDRSIELKHECTIGRAEGNTLQLDDQRASKRHVEIKYQAGQYVLRDLGAANGTLVNGDYVIEHPLLHLDRVLIGRTTLIFKCPVIIPLPLPERTVAPEWGEDGQADTIDTVDPSEPLENPENLANEADQLSLEHTAKIPVVDELTQTRQSVQMSPSSPVADLAKLVEMEEDDATVTALREKIATNPPELQREVLFQGEILCDAPLAVEDLVALPGLGPQSGLYGTLATLRAQIELADIPDRGQLLAAVDLIADHPYIRVALRRGVLATGPTP